MRFQSGGPIIPDLLLERCDAGRVVFLCGAGVSQPSGMPSFIGLTQHVVDFFDPPEDSEVMRAFQSWVDDPTGTNMPLDQVFNLLHLEYGRDEVNALVTDRLQAPADAEQAGLQHGLIKRISTSPNGNPQIVTTNFDLLFELDGPIKVHVPPAFPDLAFGSSVEGITYLHGRLADANAESHPYVLSSADFGRAYLSEAWATSFVRNLLERYTVVVVGYQAEDPPIKYLLQGLNHDGQYDRSRLFAFDKGRSEDIEAKWRDRGVTAIAYEDHPHLWQTMEAWADRTDDPREWRRSVIKKTQDDPKALSAHDRGQVAHVLGSVVGAKLFSEAQPPAHPEWICVLDAYTRSGKEVKGYGENSEVFDPNDAYGLDDDRQNITDAESRRGVNNDNLLAWHHRDENPTDSHRLAGRQPDKRVTMPSRLWHLTAWIAKNITSPTIAWWVIRLYNLHPRLLDQIDREVGQTAELPDNARQIWNLIIEHHKDPRNHEWDGSWFDLKKRIDNEGWNSSVLREFRRISSPRVQIEPLYGLGGARPPSNDWSDISFGDLGQFEVKFLERHNDNLPVPDEFLPLVFAVLEDAMVAASGLLADVGMSYFNTPTCYPDREVDGKERHSDAAEIMTLFIDLFDQLVGLSSKVALGHCLTWPHDDKFFFCKLSLYALSKTELFGADEVAERLLALNQDGFWDTDVSRELLFLLVDKWVTFSDGQRRKLGERLLAGPDKKSFWSDDEYPRIRNGLTARYVRYLELRGCELVDDQSEQLEDIISDIENWNDGWATSTVTEHGVHVGSVGTDESPDAVLDLPIDEIVPRAKDDLERDFASLTEKRPFTGLVKANPRKALSALTVASRKDDYPPDFWSALINEMPDNIPPRLKKIFLQRLARLPHSVIEELKYTICRWLEQYLTTILEFDEELGWLVFDHVVDGIVSGGVDAAESGTGEVRRVGETDQQSRRTYNHAFSGPLGMCTAALFHAVPGEKQEEGSLIPRHIKNRVERLLTSQGEGSDHAVSITTSKLNWLIYVDPTWTEERLLPMLAFEHTAAEPAWNGFLHKGQVPLSSLATLIKPLLLQLVPWVENQVWDRDMAKVATRWLGWMCIFKRDQTDGLTKQEMRRALRDMSDNTRYQFIFWLGQVGHDYDNGWDELVVPFLLDVWPRERRYRTSSSVESWIRLLGDTSNSFPSVYGAVKRFLVPVETNKNPFYRFTREVDDEEPITARFPFETLDLLNAVTPTVLNRPPYELPKILSVITETAPELRSDHRYLRLIDLVERS